MVDLKKKNSFFLLGHLIYRAAAANTFKLSGFSKPVFATSEPLNMDEIAITPINPTPIINIGDDRKSLAVFVRSEIGLINTSEIPCPIAPVIFPLNLFISRPKCFFFNISVLKNDI